MNTATIVVTTAVVLDLLFGDPAYRLHPVRLIGSLAGTLERELRRLGRPGVGGGLLLLGTVLVFALGVYVAARYAADSLFTGLGIVLDIYVFYSCIALRDMVKHSRPVEHALMRGDTENARRHLQRIVGRDVAQLDRTGIARATVESISEGFVDGFLAPLFWFAAGGLTAGLFGNQSPVFAVATALGYRSVNTLDSMVGYRNARYCLFGRASARGDDILNFLPARLSLAVLWLGAALSGLDAVSGWRTAIRDRLKHSSPNSAHAESFVAGALGVKLGGPTMYPFGIVEKPWLGDGSDSTGPEHIRRACRLTLATGIVSSVLTVLSLEIVL